MKNRDAGIIQINVDLSEISRLASYLREEAVSQGARRIPGGQAMIALAPVANLEAWQHRHDTLSRLGVKTVDEESTETPLQRLCFWTEHIRRTYDLERDQRPARRHYGTETALIRAMTGHLAKDLADPEWQALGYDIGAARRHLENTLADGERDMIADGVNCLVCDTRLRRRMTLREGYEDDWYCTDCRKHLSADEFNLARRASAIAQMDADTLAEELAQQPVEVGQ